MYKTAEECGQKLVNTVILYDNHPVLILAVSNDNPVNITYMKLPLISTPGGPYKNPQLVAPMTSDKWDIASIGSKLGYVNYSYQDCKEVTFSRRVGIRKVNQGLTKYNTHNSVIPRNDQMGFESFIPDITNIWKHDTFIETLNRKYPTVPEAIKQLEKETAFAVAFDVNFAIRKQYIGPLYLEYKGKPIGYSDDGNRFKIHEDFRYLNESLEEIKELKVINA